jgi:hypothetical protein
MGVRRYVATLPERAARATAALAGGAVREASEVVLPVVVRRSRLYQATIDRLLRVMVELVGGVQGVYPPDAMPVRELATRKAAGNVVELASVAAVGWSPLWALAAAADVVGGSRAYLRALVAELETANVLPAGTDVSSFEDLLGRLETGSGVLADAVDVPPLRLADARASWAALRQQAADVPGPEGLAALYSRLQATAQQEGRSLGEVSAAVGLAAARAGVRLGDAHIFDYYRDALRAIADEGLATFLRRASHPYLNQARRHLHPATPTHTDRLLRRFGRRPSSPPPEPSSTPADGASRGEPPS